MKIMVMTIVSIDIAPIAAPNGSIPIVNLKLDVDTDVPNVYKQFYLIMDYLRHQLQA